MTKISAAEIAHDLFKGHYRQFNIDSRRIVRGDIFLALPGTSHHGNTFIDMALEKGAKLVIAEKLKGCVNTEQVIYKKNPVKFIADIAKHITKLSSATIIGITGSNGKTTTKNLLAAVLGSKRRVLKTNGNYNNHLGVPITISRLKENHQLAVIEIGTSNPGEIEYLSKIARPHYSILTTVGGAHLKGFKNLKGIAMEKSCIFKHMRGPKICLTSSDLIKKYKEITPVFQHKKLITFGFSENDQYRAENIHVDQTGAHWQCNDHTYLLKNPVMHNVYNAQAAIAVAHSLGYTPKTISKRLAKWTSEPHRMHLLQWKKRRIIDDCYNANPDSCLSALHTAANLKQRTNQRIIAAVGDMKELGRRSLFFHRQLGKQMAQLGTDIVLTLGDHAKSALSTYDLEGGHCSRHCENTNEMANFLRKISKPHDIILIKGSRSMQMERVLQQLSGDVKLEVIA